MTTAFWNDKRPDPPRWTAAQGLRALDAEPYGDAAIVERLARAALDGDGARVAAAIDGALAIEGDIAALLVGPVTHAARRLGDFWVEDACDFVAVTTAMWHLRRGVERVLDADPPVPARGGRAAVFAAAPGDQHGFGSFLIAEVFARRGWSAAVEAASDLAGLVAREWIDLVGLTVTADRHLAALAPAIAALRRASRNPRLAVLIGGRAVTGDAGFARSVGADGTASDALAALAVADALVAPPGPPC